MKPAMIITRRTVDGKPSDIGVYIKPLDADGRLIEMAMQLDTETMTILVDRRTRPLPEGASREAARDELTEERPESIEVSAGAPEHVLDIAREFGFVIRPLSS
jgi:hypothetical protein